MRQFPAPNQDLLTSFAYHSTRIDRVPVSRADIDQTLSGKKINPHLEGQLKTCNLIPILASDPNLIPETRPASWQEALIQLSFLKRIHANLFRTVAEQGQMTLDASVIQPHQVGEWREERKWIAGKEMPNPLDIPHLLKDWWIDMIDLHNLYREKIDNPSLLDDNDLKALVTGAYEANLKLCCIRPFAQGSNRTARAVENVFRLNFGLPFKVISHEDEFKFPYIDDIKEMQRRYL